MIMKYQKLYAIFPCGFIPTSHWKLTEIIVLLLNGSLYLGTSCTHKIVCYSATIVWLNQPQQPALFSLHECVCVCYLRIRLCLIPFSFFIWQSRLKTCLLYGSDWGKYFCIHSNVDRIFLVWTWLIPWAILPQYTCYPPFFPGLIPEGK